jgi:hypothetical protein
MMNWKGFGKRQSGLISRYYPGICLEGLKKTMKNSFGIVGLSLVVYFTTLSQ